MAQEEGDFRDLGHSTAVTLATKAANTLALAEDLIIFQGQNAITGALPFTSGLVQILGGNKPVDTGLLNFEVGKNVPGKGPLTPPPATPITKVTVAPIGVPGVIYGPATFEAVSSAYSQLQAAGQYGPYALVLETVPYADTFAPLPATLTLTADRIKPLVTAGPARCRRGPPGGNGRRLALLPRRSPTRPPTRSRLSPPAPPAATWWPPRC